MGGCEVIAKWCRPYCNSESGYSINETKPFYHFKWHWRSHDHEYALHTSHPPLQVWISYEFCQDACTLDMDNWHADCWYRKIKFLKKFYMKLLKILLCDELLSFIGIYIYDPLIVSDIENFEAMICKQVSMKHCNISTKKGVFSNFYCFVIRSNTTSGNVIKMFSFSEQNTYI